MLEKVGGSMRTKLVVMVELLLFLLGMPDNNTRTVWLPFQPYIWGTG